MKTNWKTCIYLFIFIVPWLASHNYTHIVKSLREPIAKLNLHGVIDDKSDRCLAHTNKDNTF